MDVWILTKITGSYDERSFEILAIASSVDRAKELATEVAQNLHEKEVGRCMRARARWESQSKGALSPPLQQTAEQAHPLPSMIGLTWKPDRWHAHHKPGDLWCSRQGASWHPNDNWFITQTELDTLAVIADR